MIYLFNYGLIWLEWNKWTWLTDNRHATNIQRATSLHDTRNHLVGFGSLHLIRLNVFVKHNQTIFDSIVGLLSDDYRASLESFAC